MTAGRLRFGVHNCATHTRCKARPSGYFHIKFTDVCIAQRGLFLYVAVDITSNLTFTRLVGRDTRCEAVNFLQAFIETLPYHIHTVLTFELALTSSLCRYSRLAGKAIDGDIPRPFCREFGEEHRVGRVGDSVSARLNGQAFELQHGTVKN